MGPRGRRAAPWRQVNRAPDFSPEGNRKGTVKELGTDNFRRDRHVVGDPLATRFEQA